MLANEILKMRLLRKRHCVGAKSLIWENCQPHCEMNSFFNKSLIIHRKSLKDLVSFFININHL